MSTYKLDEPMRWDDFKAMSVDLQKKYLLSLHEKYGATGEMLAKMMGVSVPTLSRTKTSLGIRWAHDNEQRTDSGIYRRDQMWAAFCNGVVGGGDAVKDTPEEPKKVETLPVRCPDELEEAAMEPVETVELRETKLDITTLSATFTGWFSAERFLELLREMPIPETEVRIKVEVEKV